MGVIYWLSPSLALSGYPKRSLSLALALVGSGICLAGVLAFRKAGTTVDPMRPAGTSSLVVAGIYSRSRNPMYLGFLLLLLAWGVFLAHPVALLAGPPIFVLYLNRYQIVPEERALEEKFGQDFIAYTRAVGRWL